MIGLLFIYWIWKAFSNLAIEYNKNKWKYFFIGIGSYYGGTIVGAFLLGIAFVIIKGVDSVANENFEDAGWNFLFVLFGCLVCYGVYKFLEKKLQKERDLLENEGIDSIGLVEEN
jgi:cytochrome bd-type quinol oxidase subunit 2